MKLREKLARRAAAIPLRIGLVVALVSLSAVVLLASGVAVSSALSQSLTARTDEQLYDAASSWAKPRAMKPVSDQDGQVQWVPADMPDSMRPLTPSGEQPRRFHEVRKGPDGQVYGTVPTGGDAAPNLTESSFATPTTVESTDDSSPLWRVLTVSNEYGSTTIGMSLADNMQTVSGLIFFELAIGATALLVLGGGGYFVVRRSLRPLRQVEETAAAIAGGDLHRRVPVRGVDTEVDHLARSLNEMLGQIQQGVTATEASEETALRSEAKMRRFVADASHELRTPLTTIRGFAELYRQGASSDPASILQRIEAEAARMGLLVEDLLMLARLDSDRPLERKPVDLLTIAADAVHNARAMDARQRALANGPGRSIDLDVRPSAETLQILGDQARLRQVMSNLMSNALTHTPPGTPIVVRLTSGSERVRIDVIDSGPGLSDDAAARVFERFYRTDTSRARASGGTGLGLSIVQALVTAHGGHVTVTSNHGNGAVFTVLLPHEVLETVAL